MKHARSDYDRIQDPAGLIPEDEPVFILRGQDRLAPELLLLWAHRHELIGGHKDLANAVRLHAHRMLEWQQEHGFKVADAPEGTCRVSGEAP